MMIMRWLLVIVIRVRSGSQEQITNILDQIRAAHNVYTNNPPNSLPCLPPPHPKAINCDDHHWSRSRSLSLPRFPRSGPVTPVGRLTERLRWELSEVGTISQHDANITIKTVAQILCPFRLVWVNTPL